MIIDEKIEKLKQIVGEFVSAGGSVDELTKEDKVYKIVKDTEIFVDERRLTLEEKFSLVGYPRKAKSKNNEQRIEYLKQVVGEFVSAGGSVDELTKQDEIYRIVKDADIFIDERRLTLEEKFSLIGYPRKAKLLDFEKIYSTLQSLDNFADRDGNVDSFRSNITMNNFIDSVAVTFNLPVSIVVMVLADKKLKNAVLDIDRIDYLKAELVKYVLKNGNLCDLKTKNRKLYYFLVDTAKTYKTEDGQKTTIAELVEDLGFGGYENSFSKRKTISFFDVSAFIKTYLPFAQEKGNVIEYKDIDKRDLTKLYQYLRRIDSNITEFFAKYGVKYIGSRDVLRNSYVVVEEYPHINEIKAEVDNIIATQINENPDLLNQGIGVLFKLKLAACQLVSDKYREIIAKETIENYSKLFGE